MLQFAIEINPYYSLFFLMAALVLMVGVPSGAFLAIKKGGAGYFTIFVCFSVGLGMLGGMTYLENITIPSAYIRHQSSAMKLAIHKEIQSTNKPLTVANYSQLLRRHTVINNQLLSANSGM